MRVDWNFMSRGLKSDANVLATPMRSLPGWHPVAAALSAA
jgi:hypothetical protein